MANWARGARARARWRRAPRTATGRRPRCCPRLQRRDAVGMLAHPRRGRAREVAHPAERGGTRGAPRRRAARSEKTLRRDGAALPLRAQRVVDLRRDRRGVDVERDVSARGLRVVVAERDEGVLPTKRTALPAAPRRGRAAMLRVVELASSARLAAVARSDARWSTRETLSVKIGCSWRRTSAEVAAAAANPEGAGAVALAA